MHVTHALERRPAAQAAERGHQHTSARWSRKRKRILDRQAKHGCLVQPSVDARRCLPRLRRSACGSVAHLDPVTDAMLASTGRTALHYAAMHGRVEALQALAAAGGGVNAADTRGHFTPLHLAADAGQCEAIAALLALGASLEARTIKGFSPLVLAVMKVRARTAACFAACPSPSPRLILCCRFCASYCCGVLQIKDAFN